MDISPESIKLIEEIKNDKTHGASELARQAIAVLRTAAEHSRVAAVQQLLLEQKELAWRLMSERPAMAPLYNILSKLLNIASQGAAANKDLVSFRSFIIAQADAIVESSLNAVELVAQNTLKVITSGDRLLTHSYSSTVIAALKLAFREHQDIEVTATRSGAGRIGEKTAFLLASHGIPVTFIDDTAIGLYMSRMNRVITGADCVCADGQVVNGIGTYPLALMAAKAEVPLYVLCETLKFDARLKGSEVKLEEKEPGEVLDTSGLPPGIRVSNPYFDVTPAELITCMITEEGLLSQKDVANYFNVIHDQSSLADFI